MRDVLAKFRGALPLLVAVPMVQFSASPAAAADLSSAEVIPVTEAVSTMFDVAFGAALTSDYISRGITNSDSSVAIQGYIEPSYGIFYLNVWSSNVDYGAGFEGAEIDVAVGVRPEFGPWSFDLGYVHYFYAPDDVSPDYGEFFAKASYNFQDMFTTTGKVYFAPDFNQSGNTATYVEAALAVPLPLNFSFSGGVGYQFIENSTGTEQLAWNAGISYSWQALTFDVRYWDTDLSSTGCATRSGFSDGCDARIVGTVSIDTSWSDLTGN